MILNKRLHTKSIRLDAETIEAIAYLKSHHISWQKLIVKEIKNTLLTKAKEFEYKEKQEILPF